MALLRPTAHELLSGTAVFPTVNPNAGTVTGIPFRETGNALSILHSVDGTAANPGAIPATLPGHESNRDFCIASTTAIRRSMRKMRLNGGGRVLVPRVFEGGSVRPFMFAGPLPIEEGVELVVEGELKMMSIPALDAGYEYDDPLPALEGRPVLKFKLKDSCVTFMPGIRWGALTGRGGGRIDGNARGNVAAILAWGIDQEGGPAKCGCNGVYWGGFSGEEPPRFAEVSGIEAYDAIRNCFAGSLTNARLSYLRANGALTDHPFYFPEGEQSRFARLSNGAAGATHLYASGWGRGGILSVTDGTVDVLVVTDLVRNPSGTTDQKGAYADLPLQALGGIVGPRHYKTAGKVKGLLVMVNLGLLENIVGVRGYGFECDGEIFHTGAPNDYYAGPGQNPGSGAGTTACALVTVGPRYAYRDAEAARVRLAAHRVPGQTALFRNDGNDFRGLALGLALDYHPQATDSGDLVTLSRSGEGLDLRAAVPERAAAGGGPKQFVIVDDTTTATPGGKGRAEPTAPDTTPPPIPPARGFHDVRVGGIVHTQRDQDWCRFSDSTPVVSRLVADDLTIVNKTHAGQSDALQEASLGELRRWEHRNVRYLEATGPVKTGTFVPVAVTPYRKKEHVAPFLHGVIASSEGFAPVPGRPDRIELTYVQIGGDPPGPGTTAPLPPSVFGVALDYDKPANKAALHIEPETPLADNATVYVSFKAERYARRRGDLDERRPFTSPGTTTDVLIAHGLLAAPGWFEPVVWSPDNPVHGQPLLLFTRVDATNFIVRFPAGAPINEPGSVRLRARLG